MPLHKEIKESQRKTDMGLKIELNFVSHALKAADIREHGKNGFDMHAHVPFAALTKAQVDGMPLRLTKTRSREDNHLTHELIDQMLKGRAIVDIGGITFPVNDATDIMDPRNWTVKGSKIKS